MHDEDVGAAVRIYPRGGNRHLAGHIGIGGLEFDYFDHLLVAHDLHEMAVKGVGMRGGLAGTGRCVVRE